MKTLTQERLTKEANQCLERYLWQVRTALRSCQSVSSDEVERDIREHVDSELPAEKGMVSVDELKAVLARLGSPSQWVPQEEIPWWRRFVLRLRTGPEDWRLAYLAFGLLVASALLPHIFWVFIAASYLASRAGMAAARERNEGLGAQRWFIYPSVVVVHLVMLVVVLLLGPLVLAELGADQLYQYVSARWERAPAVIAMLPSHRREFVLAFAPAAVAVWWMVVGITLAIWPRLVQLAFVGAYGDALGRKIAKALICTGLGLVILWGIAVSVPS
jgi:hypothetical protein